MNQRLQELKEQLDYSTNMSLTSTDDYETLYFNQLCAISEALDQHEPFDDVLKKIDAARCTWKRRNGASHTN